MRWVHDFCFHLHHVVIAMLLPLLLFGCTEMDPDEEDWIPLFNGENLNGWTAKITGREAGDNFGETFRVQDGLLRVSYDAYDRFDSDFGVLVHENPYAYYRLIVEYRFVGEQLTGGPGWALRNSGIMIHSQSPESMLRDQDFPISIEVQLLGGTGEGSRETANLCTPGTNVVMSDTLFTPHCISSSSNTYHGEQWVRVDLEVLGDSSITHFVEGQEVLFYSRPQIGGGNVRAFDPTIKQDGKLLESGYIGLQSESHPIEFRRVELLNLSGCMDSTARNFKSYFIHSLPSSCTY